MPKISSALGASPQNLLLFLVILMFDNFSFISLPGLRKKLWKMEHSTHCYRGNWRSLEKSVIKNGKNKSAKRPIHPNENVSDFRHMQHNKKDTIRVL